VEIVRRIYEAFEHTALREGKAVRMRMFDHEVEALRAVGRK
jgi:hypothetical protein